MNIASESVITAWPQRFRDKVDFSAGVDGCWIWTAYRDRDGYGVFNLDGRRQKAHRLAYEWSTGQQLGDLQVDHICHNPACVRPDHLRTATNKENAEHRGGAQRNSRSGVRGVFWDKRKRRWRALVGHHGKNINVGYFDSLAEAEAAVRAKRLELFTHNDVDRQIGLSDLEAVA